MYTTFNMQSFLLENMIGFAISLSFQVAIARPIFCNKFSCLSIFFTQEKCIGLRSLDLGNNGKACRNKNSAKSTKSTDLPKEEEKAGGTFLKGLAGLCKGLFQW